VSDEQKPSPDEAAFNSAVDLTKLLISLATGAIVFSIGLINSDNASYPDWAKWALVMTWASLLISIISGVWTLGLIPLLIKEGSLDINSDRIRDPVKNLQLFFVVGILCLASVLWGKLWSLPAEQETRLKTPMMAINQAYKLVPSSFTIKKINTVEMIHGVHTGGAAEGSWHIQFELNQKLANNTSTPDKTFDVYLDPITNKHFILGPI
jgi:hypothetical protein